MLKKLFNSKIFFRLYIPVTILFVALIFYCSFAVDKNATGKTFSSISDIPYHHVGLLLGTCKTTHDRKSVNPFWKYRLMAAYELWKAKKIDKILISGDNGWHGY